MRPDARVQTAIDLVDTILLAATAGGAAADTVATRFFKERRYAGSGDRRAIRDLAWAVIRRFGERPVNGRAAMVALADEDAALAALFTGAPHAPAPISADEARATPALVPAWLDPLLDPRLDAAEHVALLGRAPLDLRINAARAGGVNLPEGEALPAPLHGLRLPVDTDVTTHPALVAGAAEVQDAASQWAVHAAAAQPGTTIIDLCAGAGGKTLALAAAAPGARMIACDTDRARLSRLGPRAERAGVADIACRLLDPGKEAAQLRDLAATADLVFIDAPCSGSGTWRRNPEGRWRLDAARLKRLLDLQARLMAIGAALVAPGGTLFYAVCSVLPAEGAEQVSDWMGRNGGDWSVDAIDLPVGRPAGYGYLLTPHHDGCDGFFMARMKRSA